MLEGIVESVQDDSDDEQQDDNITVFKRPIQASNRKSRKQRRKERVARVTVSPFWNLRIHECDQICENHASS